jgi:hypothetical protein
MFTYRLEKIYYYVSTNILALSLEYLLNDRWNLNLGQIKIIIKISI